MIEIKKKRLPQKFFLIEGIDGSGKDTFAQILFTKLKEKFYYDLKYQVSIVGQPRSDCDFGIEALQFIEDKTYNEDCDDVINILTKNRICTEKKFNEFKGITICIRGLLTDIATLKYEFREIEKDMTLLGHNNIIDKLIIIDIDASIADERIENRGTPRTWRESYANLQYFRKFYLNYNSGLYKEKIIIVSESIPVLNTNAQKIVDELYHEI